MTRSPKRARSRKASAPDPLAAVWAERGVRDPRPDYRQMLRQLKSRNPEAYRAAVTYHDEKLKPRLGAGDADPVEEWVEYGRYLADLLSPGRTLAIDATGLAEPYRRPPPRGALILHLPDPAGVPGRVLCAPASPSAPQRAACELLTR